MNKTVFRTFTFLLAAATATASRADYGDTFTAPVPLNGTETVDMTFKVLTEEEGNYTVQIGEGTNYKTTAVPTATAGDLEVPATVSNGTYDYTVTAVGDHAFYECKSLKSISLPDNITSFGVNSFFGTAITSIDFPGSLKSIGSYAFYFNSGLTSIVIPEGVTTIGGAAFGSMSKLKSIYISSTVTSATQFRDCYNLESIVVDENNPTFDSRDNCNAIIRKSNNMLVAGCKTTVIPESVVRLYSDVFGNGDIEEMVIPKSVISIINTSFTYTHIGKISVDPENTVYDSRNNCNAVITTSTNELVAGSDATVVPEDVVTIGSWALSSRTGLESVTLPAGLTAIETNAFYKASGLKEVISYVETPFTFGSNAFYGISSDCVLKVPAGTKDAYIAAGWTESVFKGGIEELPAEPVFGDLNGDGKVTIADVTVLVDILLGK